MELGIEQTAEKPVTNVKGGAGEIRACCGVGLTDTGAGAGLPPFNYTDRWVVGPTQFKNHAKANAAKVQDYCSGPWCQGFHAYSQPTNVADKGQPKKWEYQTWGAAVAKDILRRRWPAPAPAWRTSSLTTGAAKLLPTVIMRTCASLRSWTTSARPLTSSTKVPAGRASQLSTTTRCPHGLSLRLRRTWRHWATALNARCCAEA